MIIHAGFIIVFATLIVGERLEKYHNSVSWNNWNRNKSAVPFMLFSDVHLDLMYKKTADKSGFCINKSIKSSHSATFGRFGCDAPLALVRNLLLAMEGQSRHLSSSPEFLLMTGILKQA